MPPLQRLLGEGLSPIAVLTQPDRPAGRGRKLQASPVKRVALENGIPVHQPPTLRDDAATELVNRFQPDLMIVVAYGLILPPEILEIPAFGCWNIHASLLPRWRGAAPIQRAIEAGDPESGVSIMQMDEGLDTGAVLKMDRVTLENAETGGSLHDKLAELGADALLECVRQLACGEPPVAVEQPSSGATYARKLDKAEARIDWSQSALTLERKIRAFNPWPVAWCSILGERTRVWMAECLGKHPAGDPGAVMAAGKQGIDVATGSGILRVQELQRPGKRRMSAAEYLNAVALPDMLDREE